MKESLLESPKTSNKSFLNSIPGVLTSSAVIGVLAQALGLWGLSAWNAAIISGSDGIIEDYPEGGCERSWTDGQMVGLMAFVFLFPIGVLSMFVFETVLFKYKQAPLLFRVGVFSGLLGYSIAACVTGANWSGPWLSCGVVRCSGIDATGGRHQIGLKVTMGLTFFILGIISCVFHAYFILLTLLHRRTPKPLDLNINDRSRTVSTSVNSTTESLRRFPSERRRIKVWLSATFLLILAIPFLFFLCSFLLNSFEAWTPQYWSLYVSTPTKSGSACPWNEEGDYYMCPEYSNAIFTTFDWEIKEGFYLHFFPDVIMFYAFLYLIVLLAAATQLIPSLYTFMHKKYRWTFPIYVNTFVSNGTIILIFLFILLLLGQCIYWGHDHNWVEWNIPERTKTERAARTMGQIGNVLCGLLTLPLSRNSLFTHLFGTSWEALLVLHRWLGYLFVVTAMTHMFFWWYVFSEQGFFPHDIFGLVLHYPALYPGADYPACSSNFTVPLAELMTFVLIIVFGVLTYHTIRRAKFELFYYTHHFFLTVFIVVMIHAASSWYFILGGLTLWFVDRLVRLYNTTRRVEVLEFRLQPECTQLTLNIFENGLIAKFLNIIGQHCGYRIETDVPMTHNMGQYMFVNIPAVSPLEWHPFSITSSPADISTTFFIKDMGEGTFTEKVGELAASTPPEEVNNLVVNVDGPYGLSLDYQRYRRIILIAGGIGITPIHSVFRGLYHFCKEGHTTKLSRVYLIWAAREQEMLEIETFAETFARVDKNNLDIFHYSLFVTGRTSKQNGSENENKENNLNGHSDKKKRKRAPRKFKTGRFDIRSELNNMESSAKLETVALNSESVHEGRPVFREELSFLAPKLDRSMKPVNQNQSLLDGNEDSTQNSKRQNSTSDILVFTCGPEPMVDSAHEFAYEIGANFHAETFLL